MEEREVARTFQNLRWGVSERIESKHLPRNSNQTSNNQSTLFHLFFSSLLRRSIRLQISIAGKLERGTNHPCHVLLPEPCAACRWRPKRRASASMRPLYCQLARCGVSQRSAGLLQPLRQGSPGRSKDLRGPTNHVRKVVARTTNLPFNLRCSVHGRMRRPVGCPGCVWLSSSSSRKRARP